MSSYRLRRGPALTLLALVGVVGAFLLARGAVRPRLDVIAPITVPQAYAGTTYAFDGLLCLRASSIGAEVVDVRSGPHTELALRPPGTPLTVAFPVQAGAAAPLVGTHLTAAEEQCTRLLLTPDATGDLRAAPVHVAFRYGPLGLLRSSVDVVPPVTLQVTGTGTDPRTTA